MKKIRTSLKIQFLAEIIVFTVLLCGVISFMGYQQFTQVLERRYNDTAYKVAETAVSYLNPDQFGVYLNTGNIDEDYKEIQSKLDVLTDKMGATFIYVASVDPFDYRVLTYIYDSVHSASGFERYKLGYTAVGVDEKYVENVKDMVEKGERATQALYSYSKESGAHTTAGLPVKDSRGEVVAILGVEVPMTELNDARTDYVKNVVIISVAAALFFLAAYIVSLNKGMIKPIKTITEEAERFADSNVQSGTVLNNIRQKNEIGILASSIMKMETDIEGYIHNLTLATAEKERISTELSVATQIQADMLPSVFPAYPDKKEFDIYASMTPAREVGGDFYDFFLVDETHLGLVMADVSGKGVPAALFMMIAKTLIKNEVQKRTSPDKALSVVNNQLCENNKEGMFVTVWLGVLDFANGILQYANAGHNPPVLKKNDGRADYLEGKRGLVLAGMEDMKYRLNECVLEQGDILFLYTDGVTEAQDREQDFYGTERLFKIVQHCPDGMPEQMVKAVQSDLEQFVRNAEQADDITMLCMKFEGNMERVKNHICLPAQESGLERVNQFVGENLLQVACPKKIKNQIFLAIEEIYVNIVKYAYEEQCGEVCLDFEIEGGKEKTIVIRFADEGIPYNPLEQEEPDTTLSAEDRQIGGLGIFLVKKLMDDVTYEHRNGKNILTLKKIISG